MRLFLLTTMIVLATFGGSPRAQAAESDREAYDRLSAQVADAFDHDRGGLVGRGRVPVAGAVELAILRAEQGEKEWRPKIARTMDWTWAMFDSVGGGFFHTPDAADPSHPGFEKRADSNANRLENLIDAWKRLGDKQARTRAAQVIDYFERILLDGRGGFLAGQFGGFQLIPEVNGLAIHAWLRWGVATRSARHRDFALRSLDRVWEECWDADFGLMRKDEFDSFKSPPLLLDQVEMGRALLLAARVAGRDRDRQRAITLGRLVLERFQDPKNQGFYTKSVLDGNGVVKKAKRDFDENARAARFLCELSWLTGDDRYRDAARQARPSFEKKLAKAKLNAAEWALAARAGYESPLPGPVAWDDARKQARRKSR